MNIAIVGASGAVGQELLKVLEERRFPVSSLRLFGSARSAGSGYAFGGKTVRVEQLTADSVFRDTDIVFTSAGASVSREFAQSITRHGAVMIDNSSAFRMEDGIPLVVPEINGDDALGVLQQPADRIIANPNCSTIIMALPLYAIHRLSPVRRVRVATYQAASGAGAQAMRELEEQHRQIVEGKEVTVSRFAHQLAFNVIPHIDTFTPSGYTREEMKMHNETRKIFHSADLTVSATCVRVPALRCHSEAVWVQTGQPLGTDAVRDAIARAEGCTLMDEPDNNIYPMPLMLSGKDDVYVGRIRKDLADNNELDFWCVSDQIRKGAALNAVQIAEYLLRHAPEAFNR
ncbi:MAG: aspartate-semialdehyde dehydrogenase [Paludibacteraceae bacterium]|nr:aspartate-semialdehyde dehydrogenase [Paludibacteraceae bacterium]